MTGRDGQPQDICHGARVPICDCPRQRGQLRGQDRFRRDDPLEPPELAGMVAGLDAVEYVPVDETAGKTHPHPDTRLGVQVLGILYLVIERPVQMGQPEHRQNTRDRQFRCELPLWFHAPAAAFSLSARSVCSHGRSMSVRPKCP